MITSAIVYPGQGGTLIQVGQNNVSEINAAHLEGNGFLTVKYADGHSDQYWNAPFVIVRSKD